MYKHTNKVFDRLTSYVCTYVYVLIIIINIFVYNNIVFSIA